MILLSNNHHTLDVHVVGYIGYIMEGNSELIHLRESRQTSQIAMDLLITPLVVHDFLMQQRFLQCFSPSICPVSWQTSLASDSKQRRRADETTARELSAAPNK